MRTDIQIVPERPYEEGVEAGRAIGRMRLRSRAERQLRDPLLRETLGAMSRAALGRYVTCRLESTPDFARYPELEDLYPERVDRLRGLARGAGCSLSDAAVAEYVAYRSEIESWWRGLQAAQATAHCSGVLMVGPDGVIGGQSAESLPPEPKPRGYRARLPRPCRGVRAGRMAAPPSMVLRKPRTGYIAAWGVTNERGVGCVCANSCSVWLDDPIEDTWPVGSVPLLRFAGTVDQLVRLYDRYKLHNWGRASQIWADVTGDAVVVEKSFRRIGFRRIGTSGVLWCTEGHFQSSEMNAFIQRKRLEYVDRSGKNLGAGDLQYATDCAVRFTRLAELCHEPWGRGYEHIRRVLTDHAPFPRAVCRHGGPDTASYDRSVTMLSWFTDLTRNRSFTREWIPWRRFPCEVPEKAVQYPPRPG